MTRFKFFIRFKQLDDRIYTASGEVMATSYSEAATYVVNHHSWYGKIISMYLEELPNMVIAFNNYEGEMAVYGR